MSFKRKSFIQSGEVEMIIIKGTEIKLTQGVDHEVIGTFEYFDAIARLEEREWDDQEEN